MGILAPGRIAHKFADAVARLTGSRVVAVASRSLVRAEAFAREHGIPEAYAGYEGLVADPDVDAVYVAAPHSHHRDLAVLALQAGKPVLVEKPLARNAAEVGEIFAAAESSGVFAMEAMWTRFLPHMVGVRAAVEQGAIGEPIAVAADHGQAFAVDPTSRFYDPALAGGAVLDLGVYPVAFAVDLFGAPVTVRAQGQLTTTGVDGQVGMLLGYAGRRLAVLHTTMWARTPTKAAVSGTAGRIEIDSPCYGPTTATVHPADGAPWTIDGVVDNGFQYEAAEVARCIAEGWLESPLMTWDSSRAVVAVLDAVRRQVGVAYPGESVPGIPAS